MKKLLALLLALIMCLTVLTSCDAVKGVVDQIKDKIDSIIHPEEPVEYQIDKAEAFLKNMYKDVNPVTGADYEVVGQIRVANVAYTVTWVSNTEEVKIVALENGNYLVDLDENSTKDVPYTLTATITAGNGDTATVVYERKVPDKTAALSWDEYMAAKKGDTVIVKGIVVAMNGKSGTNKYNHLYLADESGKGGYYAYKLTDEYDPIAKGVKVGMTVIVTGECSPYSGMQEIFGGTFTIVDETIKPVAPIDITEYVLAGNTDFSAYVALPVTIKGVTLGTQELDVETSQYLNFSIGGLNSYIRTYVTDFPTTLTPDDKATIDKAHAEHFGDKADVTGIVVLYSGNPYLIPMSVDCFTNFTEVEKSDAEKVAVEVESVTLPESVTKDTVLDLPLAGKYFDDVAISWTSDNAAAVVGEDGKLTITLGEEATTVTLTATYKCGETTETKTYTIAVSAIVKTFNQVVDAPVAGNEYYFMMHQGNLNSDLFLTGEMSGYYYATSETVDGAAKVKVVDAGEGAYYLMVGEKYATIIKNGDYINAVFVEETPAGKFTWNTELKTFVINVDGTDYIYGTKADGTYTTMDKCKLENAANTFVANLVLVKMSTDGEVKMTADNMGLGAYADGSTKVEGFTFGYTETAHYTNGIQMRINKDTGNAASLWNETEFSFPIKEIVLVFNSEKSTFDNIGAYKFTFGNAVGGADCTVTLDTVAGTKIYTITPDAETYTYFKMELLLSFTFYWDSITVVLTEGNVVHEHVYESEVVAPKCEEKGYTLYTCKCGDIKKEDYVNATGHNFVDGACTNCDVVLTNTTVAGANELAKGTWVVVTGTVVEVNEGWSEQYKNITVTIGDGDSTLYLYRLATKVAEGDVITVTGKVDEYKGAKQIAAGAKAVILYSAHDCEGGNATCENKAVCDICGKEYGELANHTYETVVTDPDCENGGYTTYTCSVCGYSYVGDETAEAGHAWGEWEVDTPATEETEGAQHRTCGTCGKVENATIPTVDHVHNYEADVTDPTCTEGGYTTHTCKCGDSYKDSETEALGHTDGAPVVEKDVKPTCTVAGSYDTVVSCTVCGAEISRETTTVDALGHKDENGDFKCDNNCGAIVAPAADSVLTVEQALALGAVHAHNAYTKGKYSVTGVITEVYNTQYGNMKIKDENGNILTIYGTYSADGKTRYDAMETKPVAGDTVTVYGIVGQYSGTAQVKNGWITDHVSHEHNWSDATCYSAAKCLICGAVNGVALGHTTENGTCERCGDTIGGTTEPTWHLVTDASTLKAGDQIIIVASKSNFALSITQNNNNRAQAAITKNDDNTVTINDSVQILTLEAGKSAGTWALNTGSGYLYAASSSKNYLRTEKTLSANSSWSIEVTSSGIATIKSQGTYTRNWLRYNSSNTPPLFSCYGSGQADVSIYVLK